MFSIDSIIDLWFCDEIFERVGVVFLVKQFRNVLVMVGIFDDGFGEGALKENLIVVAIIVTTCRGSM